MQTTETVVKEMKKHEVLRAIGEELNLKWFEHKKTGHRTLCRPAMCDEMWFSCEPPTEVKPANVQFVPQYLDDIKLAFSLWEDDFVFRQIESRPIISGSGGCGGMIHQVMVARLYNGGFTVSSDDLAYAVCLAWLRWRTGAKIEIQHEPVRPRYDPETAFAHIEAYHVGGDETGGVSDEDWADALQSLRIHFARLMAAQEPTNGDA